MEQHGHHMPMHVDAAARRVRASVATEIGRRRPALHLRLQVAPEVRRRQSPARHHDPDGATLVAALRDVIKEFARHGVRRICLVNGHFENSWFIVEGIDLALRELRWGGIDDMKIVVLSYWDFVDKPTIARLYPEGFTGWDIEHGGCSKPR